MSLTPSNPQTYDPVTFANNALLILPVSPHRRRFRVADSVGSDLRRALGGAVRDQPSITSAWIVR